MTRSAPVDLTMADIGNFQEVLDRDALTEVCRSFFDLFGISIRVFGSDGSLLSDVHEERSICKYVNSLSAGRAACLSTVDLVKRAAPRDNTIVHPCFTGAVYRVVPIDYQGRNVGRFVLGPYLPAELREVPKSLLSVDPAINAETARKELADMPRVRAETADRLVQHLRRILELMLFSGHKAHLTSEMHVASVRENYRELSEKNAKLQEAYNRLKELDRLKSNFLATVSHELRTPLTSILGYSEMLTAGMAGALNEEQREYVGTIQSKGEHLLALITSLLDLSKLEQGNLTLRSEAIHPAMLIDDVAKTIMPQANKKRITIKTDVGANLPRIQADPTRLRQVLFNLADNALKFTPEGGSIQLAASETELIEPGHQKHGLVLMAAPRRAVKFSVRDTGIGIPEESLPRVFDAFYQVDGSSTREHGGAGLGLAIVKRLVEAHSGEIDIKSELNAGTTISVILPETE